MFITGEGHSGRFVRNDKGELMPIEEWIEYYKSLLQQKGFSDDTIQFYVSLKMAEFYGDAIK